MLLLDFRFYGRIAETDKHDEATLRAIKENADGLAGQYTYLSHNLPLFSV